MTPEELKIYQEEHKKSRKRGKRNAIKRFQSELKMNWMDSAVAASQCEYFMLKKK